MVGAVWRARAGPAGRVVGRLAALVVLGEPPRAYVRADDGGRRHLLAVVEEDVVFDGEVPGHLIGVLSLEQDPHGSFGLRIGFRAAVEQAVAGGAVGMAARTNQVQTAGV